MNETNWEQRYQTKDMPWEKGEPAPGLVDFLAAHPQLNRGTVLVPGCGTGHDARAWAKAGFDVTGYDLAPSAIQLCKEKTKAAGLEANFVIGNFLADEPPQLFDWVFEHTLFCAIAKERRDDYVSRPAAVLLDQTLRDAHELGIAGCEAILSDPNVVLHARTHRVRAALQGPFHDLRLMSPMPAAVEVAPGMTRLVSKSRISSRCSSAGRLLHSHNELHVRSRRHKAGMDQPLRTVNVRQIEYLDLRRNLELLHSSCKIEHQSGRIPVHDCGEVRGSGRERRHIRPMDER